MHPKNSHGLVLYTCWVLLLSWEYHNSAAENWICSCVQDHLIIFLRSINPDSWKIFDLPFSHQWHHLSYDQYVVIKGIGWKNQNLLIKDHSLYQSSCSCMQPHPCIDYGSDKPQATKFLSCKNYRSMNGCIHDSYWYIGQCGDDDNQTTNPIGLVELS